MATRACAGEAIVLLQALLPLLVTNMQREVALRDLLTSRQVMKRPEVRLQAGVAVNAMNKALLLVMKQGRLTRHRHFFH